MLTYYVDIWKRSTGELVVTEKFCSRKLADNFIKLMDGRYNEKYYGKRIVETEDTLKGFVQGARLDEVVFTDEYNTVQQARNAGQRLAVKLNRERGKEGYFKYAGVLFTSDTE